MWRGYSLERVLRLFRCVSVLAVLVLVLVLVVRRRRLGLDGRDVVRVVANVLLLAREPLADHRLACRTVRGVLVVRQCRTRRRLYGLRRGGCGTTGTENAATAGIDDKVVLHLFLLDAMCGGVGQRVRGRIAHGRQGPVRLLPHAIQDGLVDEKKWGSELIYRSGTGDTYESFASATIGLCGYFY